MHHHFTIWLNAAVAEGTPTAMRARPLSADRLAPAHARGQPSDDRRSDRIDLCMEHATGAFREWPQNVDK
ncbi:hypothetical protein BZM27_41000 [Paraburkholderia steynii]|uniref:Uncharacterized protein n=1 Tax=Paraburkholderia steynii TaxID=1245441 RepID=A0A4R0X2Y0_9BURK|nr:hypothetical protein BZM27_41000 [Paraburkholderia steynii]